MNKVTSHDINQALRNRYTGEEWVFFNEVANSTGMNIKRYADGIAMNIWPSKGYAVHGFEVKVSRNDFKKEMEDITKAEEIKQYCNHWWLVTPKGLVDKSEVPTEWGLMELQKNGLRITKQSPLLVANNMSRGFVASLLRKARDKDKGYIDKIVEQRIEAAKENWEKHHQFHLKRIEETSNRNAEWIEEFEKELGCKFSAYEKPDSFAQRLQIAKSIEFGNLSRLMQCCAGVVHEVGELGKAMNDGKMDSD